MTDPRTVLEHRAPNADHRLPPSEDALATLATVLGRPSTATAYAAEDLRVATVGLGLPARAVAAALEALDRERTDRDDELADSTDLHLVDRLARLWTEHAQRFVDGLAWPDVPPRTGVDLVDGLNWGDPGVVPPDLEGPIGSWPGHVWNAGWAWMHSPSSRPGLGPWLDARDREVASLAVDGVPWLSRELAAYLRKLGASSEVLEAWLKGERAAATHPGQDDLPIDAPPPPALPGWTNALEVVHGHEVSRAALYLARAVWLELVRPGVARSAARPPALPIQLHQRLLAVRGRPVTALADGAELPGSGLRFAPDPATGRGLPVDVLDRWLREGRADLNAYAWRVLHLVIGELWRWQRDEAPAGGGTPVTPRIAIPRGTELVRRLGIVPGGAVARDVDDAVQVWASLVVDLEHVNGRIWSVEAVKPARGRAGAWIVTPGEVLLPNYVHQLQGGARRLVPWPDVLPPADWWGQRHQARALEVGLALPMFWRNAAGADHGASWIDGRRGVLLDELRHGWGEYGHDADLDRALAAWVAADWAKVDGPLVRPGGALPELTRMLDDAAAGAAARARVGRKRPRNGGRT